MSLKENYMSTIIEANKRFIQLMFIALRYVVVTVGFAVLTTFAKWCVSSDHVPYANTLLDLTFVVFYSVICLLFIVHLIIFIFWKGK